MIRNLTRLVFCLALVAGLVGALPASAAPDAPLTAISLTGGAYTQDFDTLVSTGSSSLAPDGWAFLESGTSANTSYTAGTGSSATGDTYSFGGTGSAERAFGGLLSGSLNPTIGAEFQNNTGNTISGLATSYACEQWRLGAMGRTDRLDFQYSMDATSLTTGSWTDVDDLDCLSAVTSGATGALNGNLAANRTGVSHAISGLNIDNGATFWFRWMDLNASSADDGLAIDDFSLTPETPNAVTLVAFYAEQVDDYVQVTWETASELHNLGFNLYRGTSPAGPDIQLNTALIPSQSPGSPTGFVYTWQDRVDLVPGATYHYWLEDLSLSGATTMHGPVNVAYGGPTAVTLSVVQASPAAGAVALSWLWVVVGAAVVLGIARWRLWPRGPATAANPFQRRD